MRIGDGALQNFHSPKAQVTCVALLGLDRSRRPASGIRKRTQHGRPGAVGAVGAVTFCRRLDRSESQPTLRRSGN